MSDQSVRYSRARLDRAGLTLGDVGLSDLEPKSVRDFQRRIGAVPDGWLGPQTISLFLRSRNLPDVAQGRTLKSWTRSQSPQMIVYHESVTETLEGCLNVLDRRGLSVHYTVDMYGVARQHAHPADECAHAGYGWNQASVAIEVINRYYGKYAQPGQRVIKAVWAHKGEYIVPTHEQLESAWELTKGVCEYLRMDPLFLSNRDHTFHWGRMATGYVGCQAHHRWHHADGLFIEHYCRARASGKCGPEDAYDYTLEAASSGDRDTICAWEVQ